MYACGKGDFFGPLVTAGVIVDPEAVPLLQSLGVDDSKKITEKKIPGMAEEIRKICFGKYKVLQINPAKYNELYGKMKNLNVLLAWTHAAVIEDLLEKQDVKLAIADKFGDEKYINDKLKTKGQAIRLIQVPKAEQNIAVAAASIQARDTLLKWSNGAKKTYGLTLPKGASSLVIQAGKSYVKEHGKDALANVAKLHFKTTEDVLRLERSTPEN
ncbi:ribonuclease HIII [Tumebacillus amylolyticus]|uniref:ribonuclease HIII n=1 Tax=Tumebacillus amylolyticus TaxID=2801339 RepID=UPI001F01B9A8|nr:ribonuclease HIII [Tumebacillus amylolyticus]